MTNTQLQEKRFRKELERFGISSVGVYTNNGQILMAVYGDDEQNIQNAREYIKAMKPNVILL